MAAMIDAKPTLRCYVPVLEEQPYAVPELWEGEIVNYLLQNVTLAWNLVESKGKGNLFITSSRVIWLGEHNSYDLDVAYIILHAVSRDPQTYPVPCIYCQLDEEEEEDNERSTELFLSPEDETDILAIFDALSHAALLNPDPVEEDDGGDDNFIYNIDEVQLGAAQAQALNHFESVFQIPDGDEEEEGTGEEWTEQMDQEDQDDDNHDDDDNVPL